MGIYIAGMEMPKDGAERCIVIRSDSSITTFVGAPIDYAKAIPVPDHGDLIDRDALEADLNIWQGDYADPAFSETAIDDAPTIIPADREGEA